MQSRWLVCAILLISCPSLATAQINPIVGTEERLMLVENRTVVLDESEAIFDDVTSLAFTDKGDIVVASSDDVQVLMFDESGKYLRRLGRQGMGPFEYQKPALIRILRNSIFIWDAQALKLIEYSSDGAYVDEITGLVRPIKDFWIAADRQKLTFYITIRRIGFVQDYDVESGSYTEGFGMSNIEHLMLTMRAETGTFVRTGDIVLFGSPSRSVLMTADVTTGRYREIPIADEDFLVRDSGFEDIADINEHFDQVFEFIYSNSTLLGVFDISNYYVVVIEDGKFDPEDLNPMYGIAEQPPEDERRRLKLFFYSKTLDLVDSIEIPAAVHDVIGLRMPATTGAQLVFYIQEYDEDAADAIKKLTFLRLGDVN